MSDALNIPQLTTPQAAATRGADAASNASQAPFSAPDAVEPGPSFAAVLKSKSTAQTDDSKEDSSRKADPETTPLNALSGGIPVPAENPLAVQLLAQLTDDRPDRLPASLADVTATPASTQGIAADASANAAILAPSVAEPAAVPQFVAPTLVPVPLPGVAVSTAPTLASLKPAATGRSGAAVSGPAINQVTESATGLPPLPTLVAASTANSAEAGKAGSGKLAAEAGGGKLAAKAGSGQLMAEAGTGKPMAEAASGKLAVEAGSGKLAAEAVSEFRPLLERMTDHPGATVTQSAPASQALPQNQAGAALQVRLTTPFAQAGWTQEVDQTLTWMVTTVRQQADLVLNPPELGRVEVTLVIKGDEVNASFASPHQAVREAIEESLVRLRESLAETGINLGQTHVGRDSSRDAPFLKQEGDVRQAKGLRHESGIALATGSVWAPSPSRGMVDVFA